MEDDKNRADLARDTRRLQAIVAAVHADPRVARSKCSEFRSILDEYQEQPQLLDPSLEGFVTPLADCLAAAAGALDDAPRFAAAMQVCRLLQALVTTRGHKTIARFFPNKPPDVQRAISLLRHAQGLHTAQAVDEDAQDGSWQLRCIVLLWLSSLVLIPFDISTIHVDTGAGATTQQASGTAPAIEWLIATATSYLEDSGPTRCVPTRLAGLGAVARCRTKLCKLVCTDACVQGHGGCAAKQACHARRHGRAPRRGAGGPV